jgi:hypothetical protein
MDKTTDPVAEDGVMQSPLMRGMKIAMAVMGALILLGFVLIGIEIYKRATDPEHRARAGAERANPAGGPLLLPPGSAITATVPVGNRLAVTVRHPDGAEALYFVQPSDGAVLEAIRAPGAPR